MNKIIALLTLFFTLKGLAANPTLAGTNNFTGKNNLTNRANLFNGTFIGDAPQANVGDGTSLSQSEIDFNKQDNGDSSVDTATIVWQQGGNGLVISTFVQTGTDSKTILIEPANGRLVVNGPSTATPPNTLDMTGDIALSGNLVSHDFNTSSFDANSFGNIIESAANSAFVGSVGNLISLGTGNTFNSANGNFCVNASVCLFSNNATGNQNYGSANSIFDNSYHNLSEGSPFCIFRNGSEENILINSGSCVADASYGNLIGANVNIVLTNGANGNICFASGGSLFNGAYANINMGSQSSVFSGTYGNINMVSANTFFINGSYGNINDLNPGAIFDNCIGVDVSGDNNVPRCFTNEVSLKSSSGYYFTGDPYAIRQTTAYTPTNPVAAQYITGKVPNAALNFNANPHIPTTVTLTGSVFTFSNATPNVLECYFSGSVAYAVSKNGVAVFGSLASDGYFLLQPTNKCAIAYTVAPTFLTNSMF